MSGAADPMALAVAAMRDPDPSRALTLAEAAITAAPHDPRGHALRARALLRLDRPGDAAEAAGIALGLDPDSIPALLEAAAAARRLEGATGALPHLRRLARLAPTLDAVHLDLALALLEAGEPAEAIEIADALTRRTPADPRAWLALGRAGLAGGQPSLAVTALERAADLDPSRSETLILLGEALMADGHAARAIAPLERAHAIAPGSRAAVDALLRAMKLAGAPVEQVLAVAERLASVVGGAHGLCLLAVETLVARGPEATMPLIERALAIDPDFMMARWLRMQVPPTLVHADPAAEAAFLARWREELATIEGLPIEALPPEVAQSTLFASTSFHVHYLGEPLVGELERLGRVVERLASRAVGSLRARIRADDDGRLRIGICSGLVRQHTVTKLFGELVAGLDRRRFELSLFDLGDRADAVTLEWRSRVDFWHARPGGLRDWAEVIASRDLDLLVYLEVGMHAACSALAALRLAPVQVALWGHPVTTGLATIDRMLTADAMEPGDGAAHYVERLHRLPNLGTCYRPPALAPEPVPELDARGDAVLAFMPQMVQKLSPAFDRALARIAAAAPELKFVMTPHFQPATLRAYRARLARSFEFEGVALDPRLLLCHWVGEARWLGLAAAADFGLDAFRWSGGNTSLEMFWFDTPIVTLPGPLMRGRHTVAMLERMELPELIARDEDDYVRIAVRLARSADFRAEMIGRIRERKHRLYEDRSVVEAFVVFCAEHAAEGRQRRLARDREARP